MSNSFATPWTKAYQTPLFMRFPRQEYWTEYCHFIFQEIFQTLGLNLCLLHCGWILYSWATKEAILRVWAPNKRATIYMMWKLVETKGEIDRHIIIVGYFNIFLPMLDKTSQKATRVQKNSIMTPINQLNVIDIYQTLHLKENIHFFPAPEEYICVIQLFVHLYAFPGNAQSNWVLTVHFHYISGSEGSPPGPGVKHSEVLAPLILPLSAHTRMIHGWCWKWGYFVLLTPMLLPDSLSATGGDWLLTTSLHAVPSNLGAYSWVLRDLYWVPWELELPGLWQNWKKKKTKNIH